MANTIRIKRRATGAAGAPASLENAELAFNEIDDVLYYGKGTGGAGGTASTVEAIGGKGAYLTLSGTQTVSGNKTFSGDLIVTTLANSDSSTKVATTAHVKSVTLNQFATPVADVNFGSYKLTGVGTPTQDTDAANKAYVDAARSGLDVKASVRAATTGNITLSGTQTVDGVALEVGDRVLVKSQNTASQNGIYVVAGGAWARATDADGDSEMTPGMFTFVEEGSTLGDSGWVLVTDGTITVGTTSLSFAQFSGAGQITAGGGLTKTGNTLDVATADSGRIVINADSIDLAQTGVTAGTFTSVTVDLYGRVTAATSPTTIAGYGITDAQPLDATLTALAGATTGADKLVYFTGTDQVSSTTLSSFGRSLIDDADAPAARMTLGLGSMAVQNSNSVTITGGSVSGISLDLVTVDGGTF